MLNKKSHGPADGQAHTTSVVKFRDQRVNKMRQKERLVSKQLRRENSAAKQEEKHFSKNPSHSSKSQGRTQRRRRQNDPDTCSPRKLPHPVLVDGPSKLTFRGIFCHQVHPRSIGEIGCRSISVAKDEELKKKNVQSLHGNKMAEALVNQKLVNCGQFDDDRAGHKSKQFMEALHVLNSNKQLFSELSDDPNSLLTKHIQELRDSQEKEQKHDTGGIQEKSTGKLLWKKIKSWGKRHPRRSSEERFSIVILRPRPRGSGNIDKTGSSSQTNNFMRNEVPAVRWSHFPFQGLKRKMRNITELSRAKKGQIPKFSVDLEKKGNAGEHDGLQAKINHESASRGGVAHAVSDRDHEEGNFNMAEARIHLFKPLSKDSCRKVLNKQFINTTRRSLSLPEQDLLSFLTSGRTEEVVFFTPQRRFSSYSNYLYNQDRLVIHKEKEYNVPSPPRPNEEVYMLDDQHCRNPDDLFNHAEENAEIHEKLLDTEMHEIVPFPINSGSVGIPLPFELSQAPSNQAHPGIAEVCVNAETTNIMLPNSVDPSREFAASNYGACCCANQSTSATNDHHKGRCICCFEMDSPLQNQPGTSSVGDSLLRAINGQSTDNVIISGNSVSLDRTLSDTADPLSVSGSPEITLLTLPSDSTLSTNKADDKLGLTSEYVSSLLISSNLNWNELLVNYSESDQFLPPSLFGAIERQPDQSGINRLLLFDYVDEILQEVANHLYFRFLRLNTKMAPPDENVAHEAMKWIDWDLVFQMRPRTLEQLIEKDLARMQVWVDTRKDAEGIVSKMAESILEDMIEEME